METPNYLIQNIPRLALDSKGLLGNIGLWGAPFQNDISDSRDMIRIALVNRGSKKRSAQSYRQPHRRSVRSLKALRILDLLRTSQENLI